MTITFDTQVAIVTGAARGLGRAYVLALAGRGARVVAVDLGPEVEAVVQEVAQAGGQARACQVDVTDFAAVERVVAETLAAWGRVDILINNAGILRDKSFGKMTLEDMRQVLDVHVMGSVHCAKAVWPAMREQLYGRIVFTSSSSGMYGIFGQANYGAAKAAMLGLMNALHIEGEKFGIRVNAIMPSAATRMTAGLLDAEDEALLTPDAVAPAVLFLVSAEAPSRVMLSAGAGSVARVYVTETEGISFPPDQLSPNAVAEHFAAISDPAGAVVLTNGFDQAKKLVASARRHTTR